MKRFFLLLLSSVAFGQGVVLPTQQALKTVNGVTSPLPNATITVCAANISGIPCAPVLPSALFKDAALTQPLPNPFTSDANGNYVFAIAPGNYTVTVTGLGFSGYSYQTTAPIAAGANNTFTGTTTFSGAANLNGGGSLTGTFTGPATFSGNNTFSGATSTANLNGILSVAQCAGADLGAQLNTCYANLPSTGGRIRIPNTSTTYTMSTAFSATTAGKPVLIECDPGGATLINWTPTSGTAFTFDTKLNSNQHPVGMGMRDCFLQTSGAVSSTAINLGNTNSAEGYTIQNVNFQAFTTGVTITGGGLTGSFSNLFMNDVFRSITTCLSAVSSPEMIKVVATTFFACGTAITGTADWTVIGGSCDDPGAGGCVGNTSTVSWFGPHFENPGLGTPTYINSSGIVRIYGGVALDDVSSGTLASSWFSNTGVDDLIIDGLEINTAGRTMSGATPVVSYGANGHGALRVYNKSNLSPLYTPNAFQFNFITDFSYNGSGAQLASIPGPLKQVEMSANCPQVAPGATNILCASINDFLYHQNLNNNTYGDQHVPIALSLSSQYTNSTTTFTTLTSFTAAASTTYTVSCHLYYQAAATGGLNIEWTGPASPTAVHYGLLLPITTGTAPISTEADAYSTSLGAVIGTAATNFDAILSFTLINGTTAGTVTLLAKSSAAVQLQIQSGSFCQVQ